MEKIIGINPVMEVLENNEKNIEKIEIFQGLREDKINVIKRKAAKRKRRRGEGRGLKIGRAHV